MATYNKFNIFVEDMAEGVHDLDTDQIVVALTTGAPSATNAVLADLTEIAYTNLSTRNLTLASSGQDPAGTYKLDFTDLTLSASGGSVAAFQYVTFYNDGTTAKVNPLMCWFNYGSSLTLADGESLVLQFASTGLFTNV